MHSDNEIVFLHLDDIIPNRFQPREVFDERALKELALSIKEHGVIHPIIVRQVNNKYEIIAGERRYKASAMAGLTKIPSIIRNLDDKEAAKIALLENLQRRNLNPIEEARTYQKILELDQMTQEELAKTMGKSQSAVANKLRLLALPLETQESLLKEEISERHARTLLNIKNPEEQKEMLKKVIKEKLTVRQLEEIIKQQIQSAPSIANSIQEDMNQFRNQAQNELKSQSNNMSFPNSFDNSSNKKPNLMTNINETQHQDSRNSEFNSPINYGEINDEEDDEEISNEYGNLSGNANTILNLDEMKANSQDILSGGMSGNKEKLSADLDNLLNIKPKSGNNNGFNNKVFSPAIEALRASENIQSNKEDYFSSPDLMSIELPNSTSYIRENNTPGTLKSPNSILDFGGGKKVEMSQSSPLSNKNNNNEQKNNSLGFALMTENENNIEKSHREVNVQQMVSRIRNLLNELQRSGAKIDTDEMDFENQYQIVIRIDKNI